MLVLVRWNKLGNGATVGLNTNPVVLFLFKAVNASAAQGTVHVPENGELIAGTLVVAAIGQTRRVNALLAMAVPGACAGLPRHDRTGQGGQRGDRGHISFTRRATHPAWSHYYLSEDDFATQL
jgi:hypothetical protein